MIKVSISKQKLESYKRAEKVARELRYQLCHSPTRSHIDVDILFKRLHSWMNITGKIKYEKP